MWRFTRTVIGGQPKAAAGFRALLGMQQHYAVTAQAGIALAPLAAIKGLEMLKQPCKVTLYSDSGIW